MVNAMFVSYGFGQDVRKNRLTSTFWNRYKFDHSISESDIVFLEIGARYNGATNSIVDGGIFGKLVNFESLLGYQKHLDEKWVLGGYERFFLLPARHEWHTRIYTGHSGKIGSLQFDKNLSVEYLSVGSDGNEATIENDLARLSFDFNLTKNIQVGEKSLDIIFSYRTFWFKELSSSFKIYDGRFVDRSRLRMMLKYSLFEQLLVELFYIHNTDYFLISAGVDAERLNNVSSIYGLNLQFYIGKQAPHKRLLIF